jgi:two-component system sensor histidine kinase CpxA
MPVEGERPMPWTLLLATDSLYSGGLFLDLKLWLLAGAGTILVSVLLWVPLVRSLTRSVTRLTRATDEIANGNFAVRVPETSGDELGQLGRSVNRMADRLDGFVKGQKRFLGDTAHELCSPIARMQVALEILDGSASGAQKGQVRDLREEVDEMSGLINELLSFSKASLAGRETPLETVSLAALAAEAVRRENANGDAVELKVSEDVKVLARPDLLRRAIANLVRNAVRYAGSAGPILVYDEPADPGHMSLIVRDQGPGVTEPDLQRIFDPFYRAEQSRSRDTGGAGLGLAIVKTCVEACDGSVRAANLQPKGFEVVLRLKQGN